MNSRVVSLLLAIVLFAAPVFAQGRPASNSGRERDDDGMQQVARDLAALTARVAKLEGNIVAADLAGAYSFTGFSNTMTGLHAGPPVVEATINTSAFRGTLTLNADGSGNLSLPAGNLAVPSCEGSTLTVPSGAMNGFNCSSSNGPTGVTWTYLDGVITITFVSDGNVIPLSVAVGGRFFIGAFAPFHAGDPSSDQFLLIATRLK